MLPHPHEFTVAATRMGHTVAPWGRPRLLSFDTHLGPCVRPCLLELLRAKN